MATQYFYASITKGFGRNFDSDEVPIVAKRILVWLKSMYTYVIHNLGKSKER